MTTNATNTKEYVALQQRVESDESERSRRVLNAVQFLQDPRVRSTPVANKVQFLKSKGLTTEEVCEAFEKSGQSASSDEIRKLTNVSSSFQTAPTAGGSLPSAESLATEETYLPRQHLPSTYAAPIYAPHQHQQQQQPFHEMLDARGSSWGDYIIAIAGALFGGFAVFKAFQAYSPYELRRKDDILRLRTRNGLERRGGRRERHDSSSSFDDDNHANDVQSRILAPPLPETPSLPPGKGLAGTCVAGHSQEEVQKLQTELRETREALDKEKRSKAELSVTLGKLRGQLLAHSRTNENLELKVTSLQQELEKLKNEADNRSQANEKALDFLNETAKPEDSNGIDNNGVVSVSSENDHTDLDMDKTDLDQRPTLRSTEVVFQE